MSDKSAGSVPWSFWAIGAVALIWNVLGIMNFFSQMDADVLASTSESYRAIIESRPVWATGAFALGVFGGALGCLLLLLRKSAAYYLFIASLLGVVVQMFPFLGAADVPIEVWVGTLMSSVVAAFMIWYSKRTESKRWI